jgi:hypothetical protein
VGESKKGMQNRKCKMQNAKLNAKCQMQKAKSSGARFGILHFALCIQLCILHFAFSILHSFLLLPLADDS